MKRTKLTKIFILFLLIIIYSNAIFAGYYDNIDWVSKSYKDGEPDDYNPSSKSRGNYNSNFEINDNFIRNMKDIRTRLYRVIGAITVNGKVYYLKPNGVMACDETFTISGIKIHADKDGGCRIVETIN